MIQARPVISQNEWEGFLVKRFEANFLQSWYWGEFHKSLGKTVVRLGFYKNGNELAGVIQAIVEPAKRARYLTVAGGPIIDWNDKEVVALFAVELKQIAKEKRCAFARVRPQLIENEISKAIFNRYGFIQAPMHLTADLTSQLDLTQSEEILLANMRKNTRYEVRQAQKQGVRIEASKNPVDIDEFYELQLATAKRHKFIPFSKAFLVNQFKVFAEQDLALLYKAYQGNTVLAEAFVIFYGAEATYHYGASTEHGRKYPGAYLIQWEAIKEAKRRGMLRYNFWGVERLDNTRHRFYGVSLFKRGFGGHDVQYLHAQDLIVRPFAYVPNYLIETARRHTRHL